MVRNEQRLAEDLAGRLRAAVTDAVISVEGAGVHWHVTAHLGERSCKVHCFWCDVPAGLVLGISSHNAHLGAVDGGLRRAPRTGAELLAVLEEQGKRIAGGRAHAMDDVVRCMKAWLSERVPVEHLYEPFPFVDRTRRTLAYLAREIERALDSSCDVRVVIESDAGYELWAYGEGRSCRVDADDDRCGVAFLVGLSQAAHAMVPVGEIGAAVAGWTAARRSLADLGRACSTLVLEPHAELLERGEVARWHWQHVLDIARANLDTGYLPLIERIVDHPSISRFFSFTSMMRLCFSSSSNYPFVTDGLPVVWPDRKGGYGIVQGGTGQRAGVDETLALLEQALARAPLPPFVGSREHLVVQEVNAELARQGRSARAALRQHRQWHRTVLERGTRSCVVAEADDPSWSIRLIEQPTGTLAIATFRDREGAIRSACRWIEDAAPLDELRAEALESTPPQGSFDPD